MVRACRVPQGTELEGEGTSVQGKRQVATPREQEGQEGNSSEDRGERLKMED